MRIPSLRGQLRWWARVLYGTGAAEYGLFGGIHGKNHGYLEESVASSFKLALNPFSNNPPHGSHCLVPHKQHQNGLWAPAITPGSRFTLEWTAQMHPDFRAKADDTIHNSTRQDRLERAIKAWLLLGTLGRRATRAAGSVWPCEYLPTVEGFRSSVVALGMPTDVKVAVLNADEAVPNQSAEELRSVADMTVHGLATGTISGDPLGFANAQARKASAWRFKVGHFADGYRLIAVWDNRNGRGGTLIDVCDAIRVANHKLADWLHIAFSSGSPVAGATHGDPVAALLSGTLDYQAFGRYKAQVQQWQSEAANDLIAAFIQQTQAPKYAGLRTQSWYPKSAP